MSTNVPQIQWTATGIVVPTQAAIFAGVQADINAACGGNLNLTNLNSPQNQMATSFAAAIFNSDAAIAYFVNNINPAAASDFMQDAIGYLYYLLRNPGTPTAVQCQCTGNVGTPIPVGAQATDTNGNLYQCTQAGVIGGGGTVTLTFENVVNGPIACAANTLTDIYLAISGWDTINNSASGVLGTNVESQAAFAARIKASASVNAQGSLPSMYGALAALPEVTSVYCVENDTSAPVLTGPTKYSLAANSIYVAVVGGISAQIAQTIFTKKSPGCNMNGNTSVTVYDTSYPAGSQPSYAITYNVPTNIPMSFVVSVASSPVLPSNINALIQAAIIAQFQAGSLIVPAVGIAAVILSSNYFAPVLATYQGLGLLSILMGTLFSGTATLVGSSTTLTVASVVSGFLAPGCIVVGTDIPANTYIVSQLTGATVGGTGTYQMSAEATGTVSSAEAISSMTGNLQSFTAGIDQIPTLIAANITVVT